MSRPPHFLSTIKHHLSFPTSQYWETQAISTPTALWQKLACNFIPDSFESDHLWEVRFKICHINDNTRHRKHAVMFATTCGQLGNAQAHNNFLRHYAWNISVFVTFARSCLQIPRIYKVPVTLSKNDRFLKRTIYVITPPPTFHEPL